MEKKIKRQFGVWLDKMHATVAGRDQSNPDNFVILGHIKRGNDGSHSNEHAAHNAEKTLHDKFFKEIAHHMQNAEEIYITGPGVSQEQFKHYLAATPQFKRTSVTESTTNTMSDNHFLDLMHNNYK